VLPSIIHYLHRQVCAMASREHRPSLGSPPVGQRLQSRDTEMDLLKKWHGYEKARQDTT